MFTLLALALSSVCTGSSSLLAQPGLDHTAPFLGHTLAFDVDGAPASQPAVLFFSPHAGSSATPYGVLELQRPTSHRIALGATDAQGHVSFAIPIPADAALAETEGHFQALIDDPSSAGGKVFSRAVHLRLLGTRLYVRHRRGMDIVSAIRSETVGGVSFDSTSGGGLPVFESNFHVGAVMGVLPDQSRELVLFDPFFGAVLDRLPFASNTSTTLLTDLAEERVFVLETGRITAIELATGAVVGQFGLPNPHVGAWCSNTRRTEAYIAESVGLEGRPALRRIDLGSLTDLGSFSVANDDPSQSITSVVFANQTVFVTSTWETWLPQPAARGALTRIDLSSPQPVVTVQFEEGFRLFRSTPVPALDTLVVVAQTITSGAPGVPMHHLTSLSHPARFVDAGNPHTHTPGSGIGEFLSGVYDEEPQGSSMWVLGPGDADDTWGMLFRLDLDALTWWRYPRVWDQYRPFDMESAHDAYVDSLYVAVPKNPNWGTPSEILVIDAVTNAERHIYLEHDPKVLRVVGVP